VSWFLYFLNLFSNVVSYKIYFGFMHQMLSINLSIKTFLTLPAFKFFSASSILRNFDALHSCIIPLGICTLLLELLQYLLLQIFPFYPPEGSEKFPFDFSLLVTSWSLFIILYLKPFSIANQKIFSIKIAFKIFVLNFGCC